MNDFERRLKHSLTEIRDAGRVAEPPRRELAKQQLFRRLRRRRLIGFGGNVVLAGATAAAVFMGVSLVGRDPISDAPEIAPVEIPPAAVAVVDVGDDPRHLSLGGLNFVWSSEEASRTVSRIDPDTNEVVATVHLPASPGDIAIGNGPVWVALPSEGTVVEVDHATRTIVSEIRVADSAVQEIELGVGSDALWVVVPGQEILRVDLETRDQQLVDISPNPRDIAIKGGIARVLDADGVIYQLDTETIEEVAPQLQVPPSDTGDISFKAGAVWYFTGTDGTLTRVDPTTGEVLDEVQIEGDIIDFVADPTVAWVLSRTEDGYLLTPLDRDRAEIVGASIRVPGEPAEFILAGGSLWLTLSDQDAVLRFNKVP
ncbi:MAG: hypothetical protein M3N53_04565 [Actinomycetota bacterium]|nr:hypothetical protein [Actinomycetota bacterium]